MRSKLTSKGIGEAVTSTRAKRLRVSAPFRPQLGANRNALTWHQKPPCPAAKDTKDLHLVSVVETHHGPSRMVNDSKKSKRPGEDLAAAKKVARHIAVLSTPIDALLRHWPSFKGCKYGEEGNVIARSVRAAEQQRPRPLLITMKSIANLRRA